MGSPRRMGSSRNQVLLLSALLIFRTINALSVHTFFQPDEYFQSLEPAWQVAFGPQSGAWMTWEWREQLRSSLHPLLFAAVYRITDNFCHMLALAPKLRAELLVTAPKLLQAAFAALTDFSTWSLAGKIYRGDNTAVLGALLLTVCSPWQWFCSTRTFSNCLETTLTVLALSLWPWDPLLRPSQQGEEPASESARNKLHAKAAQSLEKQTGHLGASLVAAAIACILRPTNIIIWLTIGFSTILHQKNASVMFILAGRAAFCGISVLAASATIDRVFYSQWTLPPLRFLQFNVVQSLSIFYGRNRPDYYLSEGLPLLLISALPFALVGLGQALRLETAPSSLDPAELISSRTKRLLALAVLTTISVLTLVAHKETRFIYPLLPILHVLAAQSFTSFFAPFPWPAATYKKILLALMLAANIYIAAYVSLVHKRGAIDVVHYLRQQHETQLQSLGNDALDTTTVGFLMPCHSTPWRSHLVHPEIDAWALTCEPPLDVPLSERDGYLDEADLFYADPETWLSTNMEDFQTLERTNTAPPSNVDKPETGSPRPWPQHLAFFEQLEPLMKSLLHNASYRECWRGFNTHWHDDGRRRGDIIVWCRDR